MTEARSPGRLGTRPALLVIDMQRGYFRTPEQKAKLEEHLPAMNRLIEAFAEARLPVVMVRTAHKADGSTWTIKMRASGKGIMLEGSEDVRDVEGLFVPEGALSVTKTRHSAFVRTDIEDLLRAQGVDELVLCGIFLEACIADSAGDAVEYDFPTRIAHGAAPSSHAERACEILRFLEAQFDVKQVAVDDIIAELQARAAA